MKSDKGLLAIRIAFVWSHLKLSARTFVFSGKKKEEEEKRSHVAMS